MIDMVRIGRCVGPPSERICRNRLSQSTVLMSEHLLSASLNPVVIVQQQPKTHNFVLKHSLSSRKKKFQMHTYVKFPFFKKKKKVVIVNTHDIHSTIKNIIPLIAPTLQVLKV